MDREEMTNDEIRSPKEARMTKAELMRRHRSAPGLFGFRTFFRYSSFVIRHFPVLAAAMSIAGCVTDKTTDDSSPAKLNYPFTRKTNVVDDYHGVKVADPYRWLEDDNAPETKAWVQAENKVTFGYLERIPERLAIKERLTKLWNYERYGAPFKQSGRYFYSKNDGLQNQSVLYTLAALDGGPALLLDPNKLSADGTVALKSYDITEDGNLMAYALSAAGSDWEEIHVRDVRTAKDSPDLVRWVKFSGAPWTKDGKGFFYSRYDEPTEEARLTKANFFHKLYYHRLGTPQAEDKLVYHRPDHKDWNFNGGVTDDGRYLVITATQGTDPKNRVLYQDLQTPDSPVVELLMDFDADYTFIDNDGPVFWFKTDLQAPRARVIAVDITKPHRENWKEIIPEAAETLSHVATVNNQFIAMYLKDARSQVKVFDLAGRFVREIALPGIGSAGGFAGKRSDTETFYSFTSFTVPGTIFRADMKSGANTVFREPKVAFHPDDYETRQVFYAGKDGTRVPMFITHRKGLKLNGKNPTLLYGYGGVHTTPAPRFFLAQHVFVGKGG